MARLGASLDDDVSVGIVDNVKDEFEKIRFAVNASVPSSGDVTDRAIFIAPVACTVLSVTEIHGTASSTGTIMLEKDSTTVAVGSSGVDLLSSVLSSTGAANTVQTGTLSTASGALSLSANERIALDFTGDFTSYADGAITISLRQDA